MRLTTEKIAKLEKISTGFSFGISQTCAHMIAALAKSKISNDEFIEWVGQKVLGVKLEIEEAKKDRIEFDHQVKYHSRRCPDCGSHLNITPVNSSKRDQVGGGYHSAWQCIDMLNCGYEEYSTKIVEEEISNHSEELAQLYKRARNASKQRSR